MNKLKYIVMFVVSVFSSTANASLLGDTVVMSRLIDGGIIGDGSCCGPFDVVVTSGDSDLTALSTGDNMYVNMEAESILFTFGPSGGSGGGLPDHAIVIDSIDWVGEPDIFITGFTFYTDLVGFTDSLISFTDHKIEIQLGSLNWSGGQYLDVYLQTSAVPVPAAVWLFGSGLVGLLGLSRRRKA